MSPRKSVTQSSYQYDVTSRVSDLQNGEQSIRRRGKNFEYLTDKLLYIWRYRDPCCHRKQVFELFLDETSSDVMT